jgi:hypothetical protein
MMYAVFAPGTPLSSTTRPRSTCHFAIATSTYQVPSPSPLSCSDIVRFLFHFPLPLPIGLGPSLLPSRFPVLSSLFSVPYSVNPLTQKKPHVIPFLSISVFRKNCRKSTWKYFYASRDCVLVGSFYSRSRQEGTDTSIMRVESYPVMHCSF